MEQWKKLDLKFEGITSGFLGSVRQIEIVKEFIEKFRTGRTRVIIDPVIGDNGKPYPIYTEQMCQAMKELVAYADILTPNLTECCILTDTPYKETGWRKEELFTMVRKLAQVGAQKIVVSGIRMGQYIGNVVYEQGKEPKLIRCKRVGHERSGTGDIFAAIIAADCVNGVEFEISVRKAAGFIKKCIAVTEQYDIPKTDGVCFEEVLDQLK